MQRFNILLVDDSAPMLNSLKRVFKYFEEYVVSTALDGQAALNILGAEDIDLVISDENMPGISGTELLNTIRTLYPDVMRFMLTGRTDIEVAKKAINNGQIMRFFTKPFDEFELLISVRYAYDQRKLQKENSSLKKVVESQRALLEQLEDKHPGITELKRSEDGAYILDS